MPQGKNAFVITNPMIAANRSAEVTLSKFLRVIRLSFDKVTVIGGNLRVEPDLEDVELVSLDIVRSGNKAKRALDILGIHPRQKVADSYWVYPCFGQHMRNNFACLCTDASALAIA